MIASRQWQSKVIGSSDEGMWMEELPRQQGDREFSSFGKASTFFITVSTLSSEQPL